MVVVNECYQDFLYRRRCFRSHLYITRMRGLVGVAARIIGGGGSCD